MKDSKAFKEWQNDLIFLAHSYDITASCAQDRPADVFAQLIQAAASVPADIKRRLGHETEKSLVHFLRTSADSLFELFNLLKIALSLNLISIDEYHTLITSLNEIGEIINKFITQFNLSKIESTNKNNFESKDFALWTLN